MQREGEILERAITLRKCGRCREAVKLYESVANDNPLVFGPIGLIYHKGQGNVSRDVDYAIACYQRALDDTVTPSIGRALITAYYEKSFQNVARCEEYLEKIASSDDPVSQLASFWLFVLRFRRERSAEERGQGRAFGEKAASMGHVYALKFMGEVYIKEGNILKGLWLFFRGLVAQAILKVVNGDDIRLKKF